MCESPPLVFPVCGQFVCVYTRENLSFHHVSVAGEPLSVELFDQRTHQSINSMLVVEGMARLTLSYSPHIVRGAIVTYHVLSPGVYRWCRTTSTRRGRRR